MLTNHLAQEKSPYLLQHAQNPVDWYPWGEEAFEKARREDKPVFLSIGYSTCHWCHVMARESFEDPHVAKFLNDGFVCVKVDREERPDIDSVYMSVCQMMSGSCGWPLTIIMTPEKKPFLAATYIPRQARFGQQGMLELIPQITNLWKERREELTRLADGIASSMRRRPEGAGHEELDGRTLDAACDILERSFDEANGGFGTAPKFPSPHNLMFLLGRWKRTGNARLLEMAERTLGAMARGGIWDHVGFGFHRYSTDADWLVPHFEKMLYDQAMLAMAYTDAFFATGKDEYALTARRILEYVMRDMTSGDGAFFSAEDADSEGEEGRFYVWTESELEDILGPDDASMAVKAFGVTRRGNFPGSAATGATGPNILHMAATTAEMAGVLCCGEPALKNRLDAVGKKLLEARSKRVRPLRDDLVLADWNGLMIAALARAARVLDEDRYGAAARKAASFVMDSMCRQGRLNHLYRQGSASVSGNIDDYAFVVWGLLELYELDFEPSVLKNALELTRALLGHFWDKDGGGLFYTPDDGESLLVRPKEVHDGALPSGNSVAACNLLRLARMTGDSGLEEKALGTFKAFSAEINSFPAAHTHILSALDMAMAPSCEVVIAGKARSPDTIALLAALRKEYMPGLVTMLRHDGKKGEEISEMAPFVKDMGSVDGNAAAYVCTGGACRKPVTDPSEMMELLQQARHT